MTQENNFTTGQIYYSVITKERNGEYIGKTVQVIPHITDEIKENILKVAQNVDVAIIEIGGTVGDIESLPFLEAIRQFRTDLGRENVLYIHLTLVPYIEPAGQLKTKPTQHSVKVLQSIGIQPDVILCRTDRMLTQDIKTKIALFCNVDKDAVITAKDVDNVYEVPIIFHKEGLDNKIVEVLNMWTRAPRLQEWEEMILKMKSPLFAVEIAMVGKYIDLHDSYKSLNEALIHGGIANNCEVKIRYVDSEDKQKVEESLREVSGILVPAGFGGRGIPGKIEAIKYARQNKIPFFGICLGMQLSVIEFARNVVGLKDANSTEFDTSTSHPVIYLMKEWFDERDNKIHKRDEASQLGGTLRLGAYPCKLKKGSRAYEAYKTEVISERHRHRYEFNSSYQKVLVENGLSVSGVSPDGRLVELVEVDDHPWFVGCQFHPEFKSKPMKPHPLFRDFVKSSLEYKTL